MSALVQRLQRMCPSEIQNEKDRIKTRSTAYAFCLGVLAACIFVESWTEREKNKNVSQVKIISKVDVE